MTLSCGKQCGESLWEGLQVYYLSDSLFIFFFPEEEIYIQGLRCNLQEMQNFTSQTQEDPLIQDLDLKEGNFEAAAGVFEKVLPAGR